MHVVCRPATQGDEALMGAVLRDGGQLAPEYPLCFEPEFDGRVIALEMEHAGAPQVASSCVILPRTLQIHGIEVRAGLVGSVATAPEWRGRGFAGKVLRAAETEFARTECVFGLLWADDPGFYLRRGWLPVGAEVDYVLNEASAAHFPVPRGVRALRASDVASVHALYETHAERTVRTLRETEVLLAAPKMRVLVKEHAGKVIAYGAVGRGGDLQNVLHEWAGEAGDVLAIVRAHFEVRDEADDGGPLVVMVPPAAQAVANALEAFEAPCARGVLGMGKLTSVRAAARLFRSLARGSGPVPRVDTIGTNQLRVVGAGGGMVLDADEVLLSLLAPRADRGPIEALEARTGLSFPRLPLTPFVWGLDSI